MMPFDGEEDGLEPINPTEHMDSLNLRQKATVAQAVANQKKYSDLHSEYLKELHALEDKYKKLEAPIFEERSKIVAGEVGLDDVEISEEKRAEMKDQEAHLPNFWFHVLRNNDTIRGLSGLNDNDKEAMSYIRDIVCELLPLVEEEMEVTDDDECCCGDEECKCGKKEEEKKEEKKEEETKEKRKIKVQKRGFKIVFRFKDGNPYFPEKELSKTYHLIQHPMEDEPSYDGIETVKPTWNEGKNLTVKTVTKTIKSKAKGKGKKPVSRKVSEEVPCQSFFNFFDTPKVPDPETMDEEEAGELQEALQMDLEVGQVLCEDILPRAILWYTGVACQDEEDFEDYEDEDEDEDEDDDDENDDDDEDEDDEEDEGEEKEGNKPAGTTTNQETPEECKQQ